jgi:hypothetical protein
MSKILDFESIKAEYDRHLIKIVGRKIVHGRLNGTFLKAVENVNKWASDDLRSEEIIKRWTGLIASSNWEHWLHFIHSNSLVDLVARRAPPFSGISTSEDRKAARDRVWGREPQTKS